jgi:hypothetical protein
LSFDYKKTLDAYSLVQCSKCYSRTLDEWNVMPSLCNALKSNLILER